MGRGMRLMLLGLMAGSVIGCQHTLTYVRFPDVWPANVTSHLTDRVAPLAGLQDYALVIESFTAEPEALQPAETPDTNGSDPARTSEGPGRMTPEALTELAASRLAADGWQIADAEDTGPAYRLHCVVHKLGYLQQSGWPAKTTAEGLMSCELREASGAIRWMRTFRRMNEEHNVINTFTKLPPQDPNRWHQVVVDACVDEMIAGLSTSLRGFMRAHLEVAQPRELD